MTDALPRTLALALVLLSQLACGAGEPPARGILLVTWDTARADRLGAYGSDAGLTPHADRLAAQGVLFERCVAPTGHTIPSHATLFSGLYPAAHRVRKNTHTLPRDLPLVTETLAEAGYATGAFVALRPLLTSAGLARGFARVSDRPGTEPRRAERPDVRVAELAIEWLEGLDPDRPFLGWAHFYAPHTPLVPSPYSTQRLEGRPDARDPVGVQEFYRGDWVGNAWASERVHALYDGEVLATDALLGRLLDTLERIGRDRSTVVILTADHGQALGDNGYHGHGYALWNSILRVPLVVRVPGVPARRVRERVGLVDLAPTILELAGVAPTGRMDGRSLVPALHGQPSAEPDYFAEAPAELLPDNVPPRFRTHHRVAVFSGSHKLLRTDGTDLLFDLAADPSERRPEGEAGSGLHQRLGQAATRYGQAIDAREPGEASEEVAEGLRALGYAE